MGSYHLWSIFEDIFITYFSHQSCEVDVIISILQIKKMRLRDFQSLAGNHTGRVEPQPKIQVSLHHSTPDYLLKTTICYNHLVQITWHQRCYINDNIFFIKCIYFKNVLCEIYKHVSISICPFCIYGKMKLI